MKFEVIFNILCTPQKTSEEMKKQLIDRKK